MIDGSENTNLDQAGLLSPEKVLDLIKNLLYEKKKDVPMDPAFNPQASESPPDTFRQRVKAWMVRVFNIGKKLIDPVDDFWPAIRQLLPKNPIFKVFGSGLTGILGSITGLVEGIKGFNKANKVTEKNEQRKTRLAAGIIVFVLGMIVAGLGLVLLASASGIFTLVAAPTGMGLSLLAGGSSMITALAIAPIITFLIPSLLAVLYGVSLWKNIYIWRQTKKLEKELGGMEKKVKDLSPQITEIQKKIREEEEINENEREILEQYTNIVEQLKQHTKRHDNLHEESLAREAKVAFRAIETTTMLTVAIGAMFGAAAFVGLGVVSFGSIPLALTIIGASIAVFAKVLETIDDYHGHHDPTKKPTRKMRHFFIEVGQGIRGSTARLQQALGGPNAFREPKQPDGPSTKPTANKDQQRDDVELRKANKLQEKRDKSFAPRLHP